MAATAINIVTGVNNTNADELKVPHSGPSDERVSSKRWQTEASRMTEMKQTRGRP